MKIVAENLSKKYNHDWIFKKFNYSFEAGNTYAIIGPNGSGKSTLLQILWGQLPPSHGAIRYSHDNQNILPEDIYQKLSIAAPYLELVEEFNLREMIRFHFRFKQVRGKLSAKEILEKIQLSGAAGKTIGNFSSGMKQRLKLGLAFYSDTPILFLDEPTTNLDKKSVDWFHAELNQLPPDTLIFIASNSGTEYPGTAQEINILSYK
jgi:ABC-type multidrug transport system ATPase subunit